MTDNRTMAEMLRAPTEGYAEAIVVPPIFAEQFELKHSLINMMTSEQFFGLEKDNPHDQIHWGSPSMARKRTPAFYYHLNTFYNALNPTDQDSLNAAAGGNLLERSTQDVLTLIENKSKVRNSRSKSIASKDAHPYYQCPATGGNTFPEFRDNIQGYVSAAAGNYNQGNLGYRPQGVANQMRPPGFAQPNVQNNQNRFGPPQGFNRGNNFNQEQSYQAIAQPNPNFHLNELEKIKRMNDVSMKAMQNQIDMVKNELRNEMQTSIQTSLSNQTNEIKNMMASLLQMNTPSTSGSGSLPSNTVANPKGELKAITTRSEVGERADETYTDPDLAEYTIKVPPPSQEKDEVQIQKFWQMFKQLHLNITLAEALVLRPNELKCKALANLGASINLMPLSIWKELGLPELIPTSDIVVVDYESGPRVPFILGRPFLRTAHALIDVHGEEMILQGCNDTHPHFDNDPLSGSTTYSANSLLEGFTDELTLITYPSNYDDNLQFDIEFDLKEIEFLLYQVESDADNVYDDPVDSKGEKIKESKLLIDELDLPCDFLSYFEYYSFNSQDFSRVDALPSTNNEDKVFNPGILIHEKHVKIITRVAQEKKLAISNASLVPEDFDPPFCEPLVFKDVPKSKMLLLFLSENEEKVFKPGIYTAEKVHSCFLPELSHLGYHVFKVNQIFIS
nr:hypothetical protein [Tanacetum cinerariifolium]